MTRIRNFLALLRAQLWIIPALCSLAALALAYLLLSYGASLFDGKTANLWWLYSGDAGSARDLLSSLLSGLMTMTSLVVSVTFVILTLAANQLGPRLIATFMADRQIQTVLGLFLGTILYIVVVLRSLNDSLGAIGVPHIAVTGASALTVVCLFALLFYLHKIARSIIADTVIDRVANDLRRNIRDILPGSNDASAATSPVSTGNQTGTIGLGRSGYIQTIDLEALVKLACEREAVLRIPVRAGQFVLEAGEHVVIHSARPLEEDAAKVIRNAFVIGTERSPAQDLEFAVRQLVEIALRALSPGINDPFTAIAVIDRLGAALEDILTRRLQPRVLLDSEGAVRVIADRTELEGLMSACFDQIRQASQDHPAVLIRLVDVLGGLAPAIRSDEAKRETLRQLQKLLETVGNASMARSDRDAALIRISLTRRTIEEAKICECGSQPQST